MALPQDQETVKEDAWEQLPLAWWQPKGKARIYFPVETLEEDGGNRLVFRARPYRQGVKIDSTGGKETTWRISATFSDSANAFDNAFDGTTLYPDAVIALSESFQVQETGDLFIPTKGIKRVRAHTYRTKEGVEPRVAADVEIVFVEDNEDSVDAAAFTRPTIRGSGRSAVQAAQFDAEKIGVWNGSIAGLLDTMNELQGILNMPGDVLDEVRTNAVALIRTADDLLSTFAREEEDALMMFTDPSSSRLARTLEGLKDALSGATYEGGGGTTQPNTAAVSYPRDYSLYDIAALQVPPQDATRLIALNQYRIEDPFHVEAGTEVLVFAD